MQFQVPQFIETEDKIVGPFTLRQFIYVGIAGGASAMLYFTVQTGIWIAVSALLFGGAIAFAFMKVEGRPLFDVMTSALGFYWKPQTYLWKPEHAAAEPRKAAAAQKDDGASLEKILAGMALHRRWEKVQTAENLPPEKATKIAREAKAIERTMSGRYQIIQKITGDRRAAKRIDYR
jgi:hypothetical protein